MLSVRAPGKQIIYQSFSLQGEGGVASRNYFPGHGEPWCPPQPHEHAPTKGPFSVSLPPGLPPH